jgi:hypothetical protein
MIRVRFFTDEDVHGQVAVQLRMMGFGALSTPEAGRLGQSDPDQLIWATVQGYVLVTFNVADFARLHHERMTQGDHHCGIIVSQQRPVGDLIKRLIRLGQTLTADEMKDRLEYISNWPPI